MPLRSTVPYQQYTDECVSDPLNIDTNVSTIERGSLCFYDVTSFVKKSPISRIPFVTGKQLKSRV